jgi:hypothetical protein
MDPEHCCQGKASSWATRAWALDARKFTSSIWRAISLILARDICNFPRVTSVILAHEIYIIYRFGGLLPLFLFILSFFIHYVVANSTVYDEADG